ncbi:MAG: S1C family serine protease [Chloroflexota bacterium]
MTDLFKQVSDALADTVQAVSTGIVRVEGRKRLAATGMLWGDGVIITAHHVVRMDEGLRIGLDDGTTVPATLVGRDKNTDLAVLRAEVNRPALTLAEEAPRVGHLVLALGRPGNQVQATLGIISAIGSGGMQGLIQTDVVMYPGFSGGPLVDGAGKVQGMNTSGFARGVSVAISTATINGVVDALVKHGRVRQGYLGVGAQPVRLPEDAARTLGQETGLILVSVEAGSPAAQGGIVVGDIIVSLDGEPIPHLDALMMLLGGGRVGQAVPVQVVRGGEIRELTVTIGEKA